MKSTIEIRYIDENNKCFTREVPEEEFQAFIDEHVVAYDIINNIVIG